MRIAICRLSASLSSSDMVLTDVARIMHATKGKLAEMVRQHIEWLSAASAGAQAG
jgi:hypothetical protein